MTVMDIIMLLIFIGFLLGVLCTLAVIGLNALVSPKHEKPQHPPIAQTRLARLQAQQAIDEASEAYLHNVKTHIKR